MNMTWTFLLAANYVVAVLLVVSLLRRPREPVSMLAWIVALLFIPGLGILLYVLMGSSRIRRKARRRRRRVTHLLNEYSRLARAHARLQPESVELPADLATVERMGQRVTDMPATQGNEVRVYQETTATFAALEQAIAAARQHVHLEYYIWQPDKLGRRFRDLLIAKAREGVTCRVLLDSVGSMWINRRFTKPMTEAGIKVAFFLPLYAGARRWTMHLRNHRKIAVLDGQVSFLGSHNIGDEYYGMHKWLRPWYDSQIRLSGPATLFLQQTFAEDWYFATREDLDHETHFHAATPSGNSTVQILATGPDREESALAQLLFAALSTAQHSIRIATCYFVPDPALRMALIHAAYRGVRVAVVLPTRTDAPLALWAARSFYAELLDAGVEIYEFHDGMLHSKIISIDDRFFMLGSANMDVRSFQLNFEVSALVYDPDVARQVSIVIDRFCGNGRRITPRDVWNRSIPQQLLEGTARLFAPLL
jgi:cardiolipin synthase